MTAAEAGNRPNIVWFRSEDNAASYIGAYGNPLARTPTIDGLARDGIRYANHFATSPVCAPTKLSILTGMYATSMGPGQHMRAVAEVPSFASGFAEYLSRAGYWCTEQGQPWANPDRNTDLTRHGYADASGDWRRRPANAPFFALLGSNTTHETGVVLRLPGETSPEAVRLPSYHPDDPELRADRAHYQDLVNRMDGEVAEVLAKLRADGLLENTIVIYSSDHGGVTPRSKRYCYDSGLHTPLVVWFPARWRHLAPGPPGTVVTSVTSSVDAPATILAMAGVAGPSHFAGQPFAGPGATPRVYAFSGRDRMDEQIDFVRTVRDRQYRYIRNYLPHLTYAQHNQFMWLQAGMRRWETLHRAGRTNEVQSRFFGTKPAEELYDLRADPDEVHNLASDPRHQWRLRTMRTQLDRHMVETNDNGFIPEGMPAEGYDNSRQPGAFPIREVMDVAWTAIQRRPEHLSVHQTAMRSGNAIVRYWGALGCSMLDGHAAPAAVQLRSLATADGSPWVRAQAADALARSGHTNEAVRILGRTVGDRALPERVRLQAVWSLCRAGSAAMPALAPLVAASADPGNLGNAARYAVRVVTGTYVPAP